MMLIHFKTLSLQCKQSKEIIDLTNQVSFFHGKVGSGKSSIARLINFCLGGSLEKTSAIMAEAVSVILELEVGEYNVLLQRNIINDSIINATCLDSDSKAFTINAPVSGSQSPIWDDRVYNISDLIFYLLDIRVLRIAASRTKEDAGLVRLSLRNFMWYCYLDQSKLDNSFFRHEDSTKTRNSKEVLKYILQYSTQKLVELEEKLYETKKQRFEDLATAKGLKEFLEKFGFSTEEQIDKLSNETRNRLLLAKQDLEKQEAGYGKETHNSDRLRIQIRELITEISLLEKGVIDLDDRIRQQETLRSELIASKFKIAKNELVANLFQGVDFDNCPDCGTNLKGRIHDAKHCGLCGSDIEQTKPILNQQSGIIQNDLDERVNDLDESIDLHKGALLRTKRSLSSKQQKRLSFDTQLQQELKVYESVFLSNIREVDKRVATLQERLKSLVRLKKMPQEISRLENNAISLLKNENKIRAQIREERDSLTKGESLIEDLEMEFLKTLIEVGMPGVSKDDKVVINRKNWDIMIYPKGESYLKWNFYNAGSGGKKTLFNSCFLLALHVIGAKNNLPLPSFIIIDTPMKNIDKEVNQDIFRNFYDYIYLLASDVLDKTQFVIIDNNFVSPHPSLKLRFFDRYMTDNNVDHPPLIRYYQGS